MRKAKRFRCLVKIMDKFDNYFGLEVAHTYLKNDSLIELSDDEESQIKEGYKLRLEYTKMYVTLGPELTSKGAQGIIYELAGNPDCVVKILKRESRTTYNETKLIELLKFNNSNKQICWPLDIVRTTSGIFVGFVMSRIDGKDLSALTKRHTLVLNKYPSFNRKKQIEMILDILSQFAYLHDKNILVGDVKLENIVFDKDTFAVTLIDMDSVQAGLFNCDTTTPGYDSPEVILSRGKEKCLERFENDKYVFYKYYRDRYRSLENEYYAISVLIYRFLMGGLFPYHPGNYDGGYDACCDVDGDFDTRLEQDFMMKKCIESDFPYGLDYNSTGKSCENLNIWSHFPSFLKEAFVDAFKNNIRRTPEEWKVIFEKYLKIIDDRLPDVDTEHNSISPANVADYNSLIFKVTEIYEHRGFTMAQAAVRCIRNLGYNGLAPYIKDIVKSLKVNPNYTLGDKYKFSLIYNIGVLKKVQLEVL